MSGARRERSLPQGTHLSEARVDLVKVPNCVVFICKLYGFMMQKMQSSEMFRTVCVHVKSDYMRGTRNRSRPLGLHSYPRSRDPGSCCSVAFPLFSVCLPAHRRPVPLLGSLLTCPPLHTPDPQPVSPSWPSAVPPHP